MGIVEVIGECDPEEAGDDGSGVSVTLISGLGGHDDIMADMSVAEVSFSEWGGLAGSTISTGRLSKLIMAIEGGGFLPLLSFLSTRQRCPCLSVGRSSTTSPHENWQHRRESASVRQLNKSAATVTRPLLLSANRSAAIGGGRQSPPPPSPPLCLSDLLLLDRHQVCHRHSRTGTTSGGRVRERRRVQSHREEDEEDDRVTTRCPCPGPARRRPTTCTTCTMLGLLASLPARPGPRSSAARLLSEL